MKAFVTLGLLVALALVSFPTGAQANINPGTCTTINRTLTVGSTGTDVSNLQRFLVAQNYPGGGSWMITGYYGQATRVAVQNFQLLAGLSRTGVVDAATRASIQSHSCGGQVLGTSTNYYTPYTYNYNSYTTPYTTYTPYNYSYYGNGVVLGTNTTNYYTPYTTTYTAPYYNNCTYYNCIGQSINISHISPTSGLPGTQVTIHGSGFTETNNTVHIGSGIVPFIRSSLNGTSLSFTVPSSLTGFGNQPFINQTHNLYVTNSFGQNSNTVSFAISGFGNTGNRPSIPSIDGPTTLGLNASGTWNITVTGLPNTIADVSVIWGDSGSTNVSDQSIFLGANGFATLSFSHTYTANGVYSPTFIASNSNGANSRSTTVIVGTGTNSGQLSLTSLSPTSGSVGTTIVLIGAGFTTNDNTVHFGVGGRRNISSFANGTALSFTIPSVLSTCDTQTSCSNTQTSVVTPGSYPVYVTNSNGTTQTLNFIVTN